VNDVRLQAHNRTIFSQDVLKLEGWCVISGKEGVAAKEIWIALTESDGKRHFYLAMRQPRPDVNAYFGQPNMKDPGFVANINLTGLSGPLKLDIYQVYRNAALDASVNLNIVIQPSYSQPNFFMESVLPASAAF
jgi:hypothetical protein